MSILDIQPDLQELRAALAGEVLTAQDPGYDAARRVWNGAIDRRPVAIARVTGVRDIREVLRFAQAERLPIAIRGGGHNVAGHGTCDDGVVIDLCRMRAVRIDPQARVAHVQGGALWADVDHATQAFGLAVPGGMVSGTGVAGLTLGGGIGWLSRKHGLTSDNLLSARLVTTDGEHVTASDTEHPELLWALRGGGGNFGVVHSFAYRLHPVGHVLGGAILHPLDRAAAVLRGLREVQAEAPDELSVVASFVTIEGRRVLALGMTYAGVPEDGERAIAPLRRLGTPVAEQIGVMPYAVRQRLQDASAPPGLCNYWKSDHLRSLDDDVIELLVDRARLATSPLTQLHLHHLGGAPARLPADATAYAHRAAPYLLSIATLWTDPAASAPHIAWTRSFAAQLRPHAAGGYVNFLGEEGADRVREAYGDAIYARLAAMKAAWDPDNVLRINQNVEPAS